MKSTLTFCILFAFGASSWAQDKKPDEGLVDFKIEREDPFKKGYTTLLVLYPAGKNPFVAETYEKPKDGEPFEVDPATEPRYFELDVNAPASTAQVTLEEGKYESSVILKKSMLGCKLEKNRAIGRCFPVRDDFMCSGANVTVKSKEPASLSIECFVGTTK